MSIEDRIRAATRARADLVRDVRPLDLPGDWPVHARQLHSARRWSSWLIPVAAAVAVIAVAATLVAVKRPPSAAYKASAPPAASHPAVPSATPARTNPEAVPGYFVALNGLQVSTLSPLGQSAPAKDPAPDTAIVGETRTGQRLATVTPPAGSTFAGVTGAGDDRTFVLDSVPLVPGSLLPTEQPTWYLLKVSPGAAPVATLTRFNVRVPSAADIDGIALSPDGTRLAVFYQTAGPGTDGAFPYSGPFTLAVYSVPDGAMVRSWTGTDPLHGSLAYGMTNGLPNSNTLLSWASDGQHLAFDYRSTADPESSSLYLREVNLSSPGSDLFADSTVIATIDNQAPGDPWCESLAMTGDGHTAVCGAELPKVPPVGATLDALTEPAPWTGCMSPTFAGYPGFAELSLTTDKLTRVLYEATPPCMGGSTATILWSSPTGGTVLGAVSYTDDPSMEVHRAVVLYSHGTVTTLTWPGATTTLSANTVAF